MACWLLSHDILFVTESVAYDKKFLLSKIIQDSNWDKIEIHSCSDLVFRTKL